MAELLVRASTNDAALLRRLYGLGECEVGAARPARVVVDAHVPISRHGRDVVLVARQAGVPFLIDPQTFYLQGVQHAEDPWALLPFGRRDKFSSTDVGETVQEDLVTRVVDYQVSHGATAIVPPYLHLDRPNSEWIGVQAGLWYRTRRYLDQQNIALPITAVLAVGWRVLDPVHGPAALAPVLAALADLGPREVGLAASKADQGVRAHDRVMDLVLMIERLNRTYPVIAWQQGHLGEVAVAAGALGYECGIGWRESCDLGAAANAHRSARLSGKRSARPVFLPQLGRSIPKRSLEAMRSHRDLWTSVICSDAECCPAAGAALLGDARGHAVIQRAKSLDQIGRIDLPWRWQQLAQTAAGGLDLAARINRRAITESALSQVDTRALAAILAVSHTRLHDGRSRGVA
ncbi:MAG: hypothetical protein K0U84_08735 [Actinomycetia bacterium]|nr:hypothetical protein [Actinomycetes bacterium]